MKNKTKAAIWNSLENHANAIRLPSSESMLRCPFHASSCGIQIDYSKQHMTPETMELLFALANHCSLRDKICALMRGDNVNRRENKAALHTALRTQDDTPIFVNNQNVVPEIFSVRSKMRAIVEQIRASQWFGFRGQAITDMK